MSEPARQWPRGAPDASTLDPRPEWRVLHVFHSLGMGGAETWLIALLEWFSEKKDELPFKVRFDVCLTSGERSLLDERAQALGARLYYIKFSRHRLPAFTREFRGLLAANHYDVIHDHADFAGGIHLLLAMGVLPPVRVIHVHNPQAPLRQTLSERLTRAVGRFAVRNLATAVAGTSRDALTTAEFPIEGAGGQPRLAVHCGFDVRRFAVPSAAKRAERLVEFGWTEDARILLFVGRLESTFNQKNPEFALETVQKAIEGDARVRALFVGAGDDMRARLEKRVADWKLSDKIRFLGIRHDVPELMTSANLLLFPSIVEGLGMVAVEAQAAGLRVLASDTVPAECAVVPGMVRFKSLTDSPAKWAEVANAILHEPAVEFKGALEMLGASPFSIEQSARALIRLYGLADGKAA